MEASQGTAFGRTSLIRSQSVPRPGRVLPLSRMERFSPAAVAVDKLQRRGRGGKVAARADQPLGPFDVSWQAAAARGRWRNQRVGAHSELPTPPVAVHAMPAAV